MNKPKVIFWVAIFCLLGALVIYVSIKGRMVDFHREKQQSKDINILIQETHFLRIKLEEHIGGSEDD